MDARVVSAVGTDALGDETLQALRDKKLNVEAVARVDFPTGVVNVTLGEQGIPQYDILGVHEMARERMRGRSFGDI